jgi:phosphoribosylanthranilate isomerase
LGADALGFIFYAKSPRHVKVSMAADICNLVPPFVAKVGVFVDAPDHEIKQVMHECLLTALQFHGHESPRFCRRFSAKSIKAIRVQDAESLQAAAEYDVDAVLLDTYTAEQPGGTGQAFDWSLAVQARHTLRPPLILAGGLTPDNVAEAIRVVRPYAVDVATGVEREPGRKDPAKMRKFFEACRNA